MKIIRAATFFTPEEHERIRQAIAAAEKATSGEIVPIVVDRSDAYHEAELAAAVLVSMIGALIVILCFGHDSIWHFLPVTALIFYPLLCLVKRMPFLTIPFLTRARMIQAVQERAVRAFYDQGLYRTAHGTGVLIFISLLERRVWILGDRGINERIDPAEWTAMVDELVAGIRHDRAADAICGVICRCGDLLRQHFPLHQENLNELRDEVITL